MGLLYLLYLVLLSLINDTGFCGCTVLSHCRHLLNQVERLPVGVGAVPGQWAELAVFPPPTQGVTPAGNGAVRG